MNMKKQLFAMLLKKEATSSSLETRSELSSQELASISGKNIFDLSLIT